MYQATSIAILLKQVYQATSVAILRTTAIERKDDEANAARMFSRENIITNEIKNETRKRRNKEEPIAVKETGFKSPPDPRPDRNPDHNLSLIHI